MSDLLELKASVRTKVGKNANRKLRAQGIIPAIFYTPEGVSRILQVEESALMKLYRATGRTSIFNLELDNNGKAEKYTCLIWDVEYYPTKQRFQHVDFYGVDLDKELKIRVPLEFSGVSKGAKAGGKVETYRDQIDIWSKPATLPKKIVVDITNLDINQGFRVTDLVMPEGVRAAYDDNYAVITVNAPGGRAEEDAK